MRDAYRPWYWDELGIEGGCDAREIKRAYARRLKTTRPDDDAEGFQRLRVAYEQALQALQGREPEAATVAAPQDDERDVSVPVEASPPPAPGAMPVIVLPVQGREEVAADPEQIAAPVWQRCLAAFDAAGGTQDYAAVLARAHDDERLQPFAVREAFELLAARHGADAACTVALRAALVDYFDWNGRGLGCLRQYPALASELLSRHAADVGWNHLNEQARTDPLLAWLVKDTVPARLPQRWNARFVRGMRDTLQTIRWHHPELLAHRLDPEVFGWWERQVQDKAYFRQTAFWSGAFGLGLWLMVMTLFPVAFGAPELGGALMLGCVVLSMAVAAWLVVRPPAQLYARADAAQLRWLGKPLLEARYDRAWQFGWMPPFVLLALAMLLPHPPPLLAAAIATGLGVCAAFAMLAGSLTMSRVRFAVVFVLAAIAAFICAQVGFDGAGEFAMLAFWLCLLTVFLNIDNVHYRILGWNAGLLRNLRAGWLTAGIVSAFCSATSVAPALQLPMLMLLVATGVFMARSNAYRPIFWLVVFSIGPIIRLIGDATPEPRTQALAAMTLAVAYFVIGALSRAGTDV